MTAVLLAAAIGPVAAQEAADDGDSTLPVTLQRIYAAGVPTSVDELRLMDEHQRALVQRLTPVTVGLSIGPTQGSGVIISADGYILTAAHVAGQADQKVHVMTSDGRSWSGKTLGMNNGMDAALIKIQDPPPGDEQQATTKAEWPHAEMGDARKLEPGSWCLALGHPGGYQRDRQPAARFGRVLNANNAVIETDCILIGGDSGGPLFDMEGRVVGIHSRIGNKLTKNVHVPVHAYRDSWKRMARGESWGRLQDLVGSPMIGVRGARDSNEPRIFQVVPASPAEAAGLQAGDLVVQFGGEEVKRFDDLKRLVARRNPGDEVTIVITRGTETKEIGLVVGSGSVQ